MISLLEGLPMTYHDGSFVKFSSCMELLALGTGTIMSASLKLQPSRWRCVCLLQYHASALRTLLSSHLTSSLACIPHPSSFPRGYFPPNSEVRVMSECSPLETLPWPLCRPLQPSTLPLSPHTSPSQPLPPWHHTPTLLFLWILDIKPSLRIQSAFAGATRGPLH